MFSLNCQVCNRLEIYPPSLTVPTCKKHNRPTPLCHQNQVIFNILWRLSLFECVLIIEFHSLKCFVSRVPADVSFFPIFFFSFLSLLFFLFPSFFFLFIFAMIMFAYIETLTVLVPFTFNGEDAAFTTALKCFKGTHRCHVEHCWPLLTRPRQHSGEKTWLNLCIAKLQISPQIFMNFKAWISSMPFPGSPFLSIPAADPHSQKSKRLCHSQYSRKKKKKKKSIRQ